MLNESIFLDDQNSRQRMNGTQLRLRTHRLTVRWSNKVIVHAVNEACCTVKSKPGLILSFGPKINPS